MLPPLADQAGLVATGCPAPSQPLAVAPSPSAPAAPASANGNGQTVASLGVGQRIAFSVSAEEFERDKARCVERGLCG